MAMAPQFMGVPGQNTAANDIVSRAAAFERYMRDGEKQTEQRTVTPLRAVEK